MNGLLSPAWCRGTLETAAAGAAAARGENWSRYSRCFPSGASQQVFLMFPRRNKWEDFEAMNGYEWIKNDSQ